MGGEQTQLVSVEESGTFKNWKYKNTSYLMNREPIYKTKLSHHSSNKFYGNFRISVKVATV